MKRLLATAAAATLLVAAAPAADPPEGYAHEVTFDTTDEAADAVTIDGGLPGGANLTPFLGRRRRRPELRDRSRRLLRAHLPHGPQPRRRHR